MSNAGPTLNCIEREPDRDREREDDLAAGDLGHDLAVVVLLARRDVRRDREGPEPDRERLAEGDDAPDHGEPPHAVALHRRRDVADDLLDAALGRPHRDGPARRPRIITPSRTAWPPYDTLTSPPYLARERDPAERTRRSASACGDGRSLKAPPVAVAVTAALIGELDRPRLRRPPLGELGRRGLLEAALEALHPAAGVHELLLARVERMACGAHSTWSSAFVERVMNSLPHEQVTCETTYSGWMSTFIEAPG